MEKNKLMMIIIIVLLVILLAAIGGVSVLALKTMSKTAAPATATASAAAVALKPSQINTIDLTDAISVNLAVGSDGVQHSVSVKVSVGMDNTQKKDSTTAFDMVNSKQVIIRDAIISVLRQKTEDDLKKSDAEELLKHEILEKLQTQFNSNLIVAIYLSNIYYD